MTVRAKPWTLDSNGNSNTCDGTSGTINGWSGGSTSDFIQQLVDECGDLCEPCSGTIDSDGDGLADDCDDCHNLPGDVNDDLVIDVLDIVSLVNEILYSQFNYEGADFWAADTDFDEQLNVLDVIKMVSFALTH